MAKLAKKARRQKKPNVQRSKFVAKLRNENFVRELEEKSLKPLLPHLMIVILTKLITALTLPQMNHAESGEL